MKIPLPTQMMLDASKIVQAYWLPATVTVICLAFAFRSYIKTTSGRMWWDSLLLTVPMLGDAVRKAETARFARAMSTLSDVVVDRNILVAIAALSIPIIAASKSEKISPAMLCV